jgi:hypothetical protein
VVIRGLSRRFAQLLNVARRDVENDLFPLGADSNVSIHEGKVCVCNALKE